MENEKVIIGFLTILILSTAFYVTLTDQGLKIRIDDDKSTFYVKNQINRFVVSGREYNKLFDGTSLMYRRPSEITREITFDLESNTTTIVRTTPYIRGPVIVDTYFFKGNSEDVGLFPIYHKVEIYNGAGKFYRYEVRDLRYIGLRKKLDTTEMDFGRNMKVTWQDGYRWAWVYANGVLKIQYKIESDYEVFNVRLFDPEDIITYKYIYENLSRQVPNYKYEIIEVKPVYSSLNGTWSKGYNYTKREFIDYKTEYYTKEGILNRIGVKVGNENLFGWCSVCGNYLVHRLYNPGDLNEDEFCRCRQYVIDKGLCTETNLIKAIKWT